MIKIDKKRVAALISLTTLGAGSAYVMRDEIEELLRDIGVELKTFSETKETSFEKSERERIEMPDTKLLKDVNYDPNWSSVSWEKLKKNLGFRYPGRDLSKLYSALTPEEKAKWRLGIYFVGVRTYPDRYFVYTDAWYISPYDKKGALADLVQLYRIGSINFEMLLAHYKSVVKSMYDLP